MRWDSGVSSLAQKVVPLFRCAAERSRNSSENTTMQKVSISRKGGRSGTGLKQRRMGDSPLTSTVSLSTVSLSTSTQVSKTSQVAGFGTDSKVNEMTDREMTSITKIEMAFARCDEDTSMYDKYVYIYISKCVCVHIMYEYAT